MKPYSKQNMEAMANWYASTMFETGENWNPQYWSLTKDNKGFNIKNKQGKIIQSFVFDFENNRYQRTDFVKQSGSSKLVAQEPQWFKIPKDFNMIAKVDPERNYPQLNFKKPGDKQFFVEHVVDGYIDPETKKWMDQRSLEPDFDPWDDEFDDCDYQKIEIYTIWAPNRKTLEIWANSGQDFQDKDGNDGWIGGIISKEELTPIKIKEAVK